jgi:hypothetical protein
MPRPATAQRLVNGRKCPLIGRHDEHIVRLVIIAAVKSGRESLTHRSGQVEVRLRTLQAAHIADLLAAARE